MGALQAVTILLRQLFQSRGALVAENLAVLAYSSRSTENRPFRPGHIKKEGVFQMGFLLLGGLVKPGKQSCRVFPFLDDLALELVQISAGIRIYPNTPLVDQAITEGRITPHGNLSSPTFYVVDDMKDWMYETVGRWAEDRPNWMF